MCVNVVQVSLSCCPSAEACSWSCECQLSCRSRVTTPSGVRFCCRVPPGWCAVNLQTSMSLFPLPENFVDLFEHREGLFFPVHGRIGNYVLHALSLHVIRSLFHSTQFWLGSVDNSVPFVRLKWLFHLENLESEKCSELQLNGNCSPRWKSYKLFRSIDQNSSLQE